MTDLEIARHLFQQAGLTFPAIPEELATGLRGSGEGRVKAGGHQAMQCH